MVQIYVLEANDHQYVLMFGLRLAMRTYHTKALQEISYNIWRAPYIHLNITTSLILGIALI